MQFIELLTKFTILQYYLNSYRNFIYCLWIKGSHLSLSSVDEVITENGVQFQTHGQKGRIIRLISKRHLNHFRIHFAQISLTTVTENQSATLKFGSVY